MIRNDDNDDGDDDDDANDVDDGVQDDDGDDDDDDDVVGVPEVSMPVVDRARCPSRLQSISEGKKYLRRKNRDCSLTQSDIKTRVTNELQNFTFRICPLAAGG